MAALKDSAYCYIHDPSCAQERAKSRKRGGHHRKTPKMGSERLEGIELRDIGSIQGVLEAVVADTLAQDNSATRSRTVGYLLGLAMKAIEVGELETRLAALEDSFRETNQ